jgi:hypothetical protein
LPNSNARSNALQSNAPSRRSISAQEIAGLKTLNPDRKRRRDAPAGPETGVLSPTNADAPAENPNAVGRSAAPSRRASIACSKKTSFVAKHVSRNASKSAAQSSSNPAALRSDVANSAKRRKSRRVADVNPFGIFTPNALHSQRFCNNRPNCPRANSKKSERGALEGANVPVDAKKAPSRFETQGA